MFEKVLVVGGSGFIGSRLLARNPDWDNIDLKKKIDFRVRPYAAFDYDAIVFLAAKLGNKKEDYHYNLELYKSLLDAVLLSKKQPFVVYSSSAAVYEATIGEHWEDELPKPETLYGKSKLMGEQIIQDICDKFAILRFSNVYGDGDGNGAIDIFKRGGRIIYGDGEQIRDFIYVNKVVTAIERVLGAPERYNGKIFNISSGEPMAVLDAYEKFGRDNDPEFAPEREFDVRYSVLDNALAKKEGLL